VSDGFDATLLVLLEIEVVADFCYRNDDTSGMGALTTFMTTEWWGTASTQFDDIYISEGASLTNPVLVPEPASLGLIGAGALMVLAGRRRRSC
jgi:hypothetical protein